MVVAKRPKRAATPDEALRAQRDALARQLRAVLRLVDRGGFMWPEDQALVAGSEALLVEVEGT